MMRYWISSWRISDKIRVLCISKYTAMLRSMRVAGAVKVQPDTEGSGDNSST
jgi:hypothetical protein